MSAFEIIYIFSPANDERLADGGGVNLLLKLRGLWVLV